MRKIFFATFFVLVAAASFAQDISLPPPAAKSGIDLISAMQGRRISRMFVKKEIPMADLSTILWSGLGLRPVDAVSSATKAGRIISFSGDNVYINLYVLSSKGVWKYQPENNTLKSVSKLESRPAVSTAAIPAASVMILFTVDNALMPSFLKGNPETFQLMAHATAGFAAQNIALTASALKLASIVQYTLNPAKASAAAGLGKEEVPLFIQQLGYTE